MGWFFLDFRYISSYHNTVAVMSIVGYHVQQFGREQTEPVERKPAPDTDAGKVIHDQNGLIAPLPGKRRRKPPIGIVLVAIAVGITAVSLLIPRDSQYINAVKNGYPNAYPDQTYGEAFESFFENPEWTYFKSTDGLDIVGFSGDYQNSFSETPVTFQFTLSEDGDTMEVTYCELNGEPQSQLALAIMIAAVFEEENAGILSETSDVLVADSEPQTIYGLYECHEDGLDASLEAGVYTDDGTEYISLMGASSDGSGEFYGTVVSSEDNHYTAVDDSGNAIDIYFDGIGNASVTDHNTLGGLYFPGFTGTYQKAEDFSNAG